MDLFTDSDYDRNVNNCEIISTLVNRDSICKLTDKDRETTSLRDGFRKTKFWRLDMTFYKQGSQIHVHIISPP